MQEKKCTLSGMERAVKLKETLGKREDSKLDMNL